MIDEKYEMKKLFAAIAPQRSDEELLNAVLERKAENMSQKKNKLKKAVAIPVAAALALGVTAVGVSAAANRSLGDMFGAIFARSYTEYSPAEGEAPYFDFSGIGKPLNMSFECDFGKVNILGIAADLHTAYLLYDIEFNEDFDYALGEGEEWSANLLGEANQNIVQSVSTLLSGKSTSHGGGSTSEFLGMEGNIAHFASTVYLHGDTLDRYYLSFSLDSISRLSRDNSAGENIPITEEVIPLDEISFDTSLDFDITENSLVLEEERTVEIAGDKAVITRAEISTFGIEVQLLPEEKSVEAIERIYTALSENRYEMIRYTLTDDTEIEVRANSLGYHTSSDTSGALNYGNLRISANWNYPLYMDKISSFEICGTTFELAPAES